MQHWWFTYRWKTWSMMKYTEAQYEPCAVLTHEYHHIEANQLPTLHHTDEWPWTASVIFVTGSIYLLICSIPSQIYLFFIWLICVCLLRSRFTQKVLNWFPCNFVNGLNATLHRTHSILVHIRIREWIQKCIFHIPEHCEIGRFRTFLLTSQKIIHGFKSGMFKGLIFMSLCNLVQIQIKISCVEKGCK